MMNHNHPFHLVSLSPWPLLCSLSLMNLLFGFLCWMHEFNMVLFYMSLFCQLIIMYQWWRDVIREGLYQGCHTLEVMQMMRFGMILFIVSELMFFVSFFWSYYHFSLSPSIEIGSNWPPNSIILFNPYCIPLLNTLILLTSGVSLTVCHYGIFMSKFDISYKMKFITIFLGILFTFFQWMEYTESYYTIADSVFGTVFFMMTGFHGLHVLIGTLFIIVSYDRLKNFHYSSFHHLGFEFSSWYWHFVDVVWLFLYVIIYWSSW